MKIRRFKIIGLCLSAVILFTSCADTETSQNISFSAGSVENSVIETTAVTTPVPQTTVTTTTTAKTTPPPETTVITTTTAETTPPPETTVTTTTTAGTTPPIKTFTIWSLGVNEDSSFTSSIYSDIDCLDYIGSYGEGCTLTAVKTIKDKGVYQLEDGNYAKISDWSNTPHQVEEMFLHPTEHMDEIKQYIVNDGEKNFDLIHDDNENWVPKGSSWFSPHVYDKNSIGHKTKDTIVNTVRENYERGHMSKGKTFRIYIEKVKYEECGEFGYSVDVVTGRPAMSREEFEALDAYAVYFLRG